MTAIKVDKGVPMPSRRNKYPWRDMEVGDSFFVPGKTSGDFGGAIAVARTRSGRKFSGRTVTEDGVKGCRIWRVE